MGQYDVALALEAAFGTEARATCLQSGQLVQASIKVCVDSVCATEHTFGLHVYRFPLLDSSISYMFPSYFLLSFASSEENESEISLSRLADRNVCADGTMKYATAAVLLFYFRFSDTSQLLATRSGALAVTVSRE